MFRFAIILCAVLAGTTAQARLGYVETLDGRIFEGHIRFESNAVVVVDAAAELRVVVGLSNVAHLSLETSGIYAPPKRHRASVEGGNGLPMNWRDLDVGSMHVAGGVEVLNGFFRVRSSGTNILSEADSFHFVFKPVRGNSQFVARVARVQGVDAWARAGLMMRESLAADARQVSLTVTPGRGGVWSAREQRRAEASVTLDRSMKMPCWMKLKRDGDEFTAWYSPNGRSWRLVERVSMPMAEEFYVGLALAGVREDVVTVGSFEEVEEAPSLRNWLFTPQVELRSGSVQTGWIESMDDSAVRFDSFQVKAAVSTRDVAVLRFQPVPTAWASRISSGLRGVLLTSGEFVEAECRGIEGAALTMSSVPLGLMRYDVNSEVIAVVLARRAVPQQLVFTVTTVDGSRWLATEVQFDSQWLTLREPSLGTRRIRAAEVAEVRRSI